MQLLQTISGSGPMLLPDCALGQIWLEPVREQMPNQSRVPVQTGVGAELSAGAGIESRPEIQRW
jgi:hypothetical protein